MSSSRGQVQFITIFKIMNIIIHSQVGLKWKHKVSLANLLPVRLVCAITQLVFAIDLQPGSLPCQLIHRQIRIRMSERDAAVTACLHEYPYMSVAGSVVKRLNASNVQEHAGVE